MLLLESWGLIQYLEPDLLDVKIQGMAQPQPALMLETHLGSTLLGTMAVTVVLRAEVGNCIDNSGRRWSESNGKSNGRAEGQGTSSFSSFLTRI